MELFKDVSVMKVTKDKLTEMILKSLNEQVEEGKIGRALAGLGLAATLATSMPSCGYIHRNEPDMHWTHEGPYSEQEKREKTWNTHNERGDWENVEPGVGFIYDCYTRCNPKGWTIHVIFADKSTGKFVLPQECREYLDGRYMPNCNCFENENTTDRVNTNGLQRLDNNNSENNNDTTTYLEENNNNIMYSGYETICRALNELLQLNLEDDREMHMAWAKAVLSLKNLKKRFENNGGNVVNSLQDAEKQTIKIKESQLRDMVKESITEFLGFGGSGRQSQQQTIPQQRGYNRTEDDWTPKLDADRIRDYYEYLKSPYLDPETRSKYVRILKQNGQSVPENLRTGKGVYGSWKGTRRGLNI